MHLVIENSSKSNDPEFLRPCLCAQRAKCYQRCALGCEIDREDKAELRKFATKKCKVCKSSGIVYILDRKEDQKRILLSDRNAKILFSLLSIKFHTEGEISFKQLSKALKGVSPKKLKKYVIPDKKKFKKAWTTEYLPGMTLTYKPLKSFQVGLPKEKLEEYLIRLEELIDEGKELGADSLQWRPRMDEK